MSPEINGFVSSARDCSCRKGSVLLFARERGYSSVQDSYAVGTTAMAVPIVRRATGVPIGTLSVAGPSMRLSSQTHG
ncbi:hypothetical protein ICI42_19565 [Tianweitania sp. Rool2]|uniref:IclR-ED domain-containing protein n=1 Tax=Oryzicola mucosus TaxID=2767425 RepID=A0A8J6Q549_9HYPH|nr:hypothetical protein [Oryzicola mucosus]